jgi:hypothetical protein
LFVHSLVVPMVFLVASSHRSFGSISGEHKA